MRQVTQMSVQLSAHGLGPMERALNKGRDDKDACCFVWYI